MYEVIIVLENLIIRKANIGDCDILNKLFESLLIYERNLFDENIKSNINITSYFNKKINDDNYIILVASIDKVIIGYICGYIDSDNKIKEEIEVNIESLYVEDKYRNNGVGTHLINEFINIAKSLDIRYVLIDNFINNKSAKNLYDKLGFKVLKENRRKII